VTVQLKEGHVNN